MVIRAFILSVIAASAIHAQTVTTYDSRSGAPLVSPYRAIDIADPNADLFRQYDRPDVPLRAFVAPALIDLDTSIGVTITGTVAQAEADLARRTAQRPLTPTEMLLRRIATEQVLTEELSQEELDSLAELHAPWASGISVAVDEVYRFEGVLYRVIQGHTTQSDWTPPTVPALFTAIAPPGTVAQWVQPTGAQDAYQIGDQVTHIGKTWESTAANNVWEPGVFGWVEL